MRIIKLNATESTNTLAREYYQSNKNLAPFCVVAEAQTSGRGQRGASWVSNAGENLTMSIVFPNPSVDIKDQFLLSASTGIAVLNTLNDLKIKSVKLKWPNDIMAANYKVGGILIENILSRGSIGASIIGLGLNVNQLEFPGLPKASSLQTLAGKKFELEELRNLIIQNLQTKISYLANSSSERILENYEDVLFRRNKVSTFELANGKLFSGIIKGITPTGLLKVEVEDENLEIFDLKELKLLF